MKILNFGSCNIDTVYTVAHIAAPGETVSAKTAARYPGGKGLNQSIALARAGAPVYHAGCVGENAEFLLDVMRDSGVDISLIRTVEGITGQAFIQVGDNGENSILVYKGSNGAVTRDYVDEVLGHFSAGDLLVLQNEISEMPYIIECGYAKGMRIVLNPSPFDESMRAVPLEKIAYLILNETEAAGYAGNQDFITWKKERYPSLRVVLTLGSKGALYLDETTCVRQPCFTVDAVDTTAAGDTFTGFFMAEIARGKSPSAALRTAAIASALAVSAAGASTSIPLLARVRQAAGELKEHPADPLTFFVQEFFRLHYREATLQQLADYLGYSTNYTAAWLRAHMDTTFSELLKQARCRRCEYLLTNTDRPIADIITDVGYSNETFLRKLFVEKYGMTPLQYRKRKVCMI